MVFERSFGHGVAEFRRDEPAGVVRDEVQIPFRVLGFADERSGIGALDTAESFRVADFAHQLGVPIEVKATAAQTRELHGAIFPLALPAGQVHSGNDDHVLHVGTGNVGTDLAEPRLEILILPTVATVGVDADRFVVVEQFAQVEEIIRAHCRRAAVNLVPKVLLGAFCVFDKRQQLGPATCIAFLDQVVATVRSAPQTPRIPGRDFPAPIGPEEHLLEMVVALGAEVVEAPDVIDGSFFDFRRSAPVDARGSERQNGFGSRPGRASYPPWAVCRESVEHHSLAFEHSHDILRLHQRAVRLRHVEVRRLHTLAATGLAEPDEGQQVFAAVLRAFQRRMKKSLRHRTNSFRLNVWTLASPVQDQDTFETLLRSSPRASSAE